MLYTIHSIIIRMIMSLVVMTSLYIGNINSQESGVAISVDGTRISYRIFGKGQPLLIINGGPGMNSDGFEGLTVKKLSMPFQIRVWCIWIIVSTMDGWIIRRCILRRC